MKRYQYEDEDLIWEIFTIPDTEDGKLCRRILCACIIQTMTVNNFYTIVTNALAALNSNCRFNF